MLQYIWEKAKKEEDLYQVKRDRIQKYLDLASLNEENESQTPLTFIETLQRFLAKCLTGLNYSELNQLVFMLDEKLTIKKKTFYKTFENTSKTNLDKLLLISNDYIKTLGFISTILDQILSATLVNVIKIGNPTDDTKSETTHITIRIDHCEDLVSANILPVQSKDNLSVSYQNLDREIEKQYPEYFNPKQTLLQPGVSKRYSYEKLQTLPLVFISSFESSEPVYPLPDQDPNSLIVPFSFIFNEKAYPGYIPYKEFIQKVEVPTPLVIDEEVQKGWSFKSLTSIFSRAKKVIPPSKELPQIPKQNSGLEPVKLLDEYRMNKSLPSLPKQKPENKSIRTKLNEFQKSSWNSLRKLSIFEGNRT